MAEKFGYGDGKIVPEEITEEEKPEFVDMEESNLARKARESARGKQEEFEKRVKILEKDPVAHLDMSRWIEARVKGADDVREGKAHGWEIIKDDYETAIICDKSGNTIKKDGKNGEVELYVIEMSIEIEGKKHHLFVFGKDKRDAVRNFDMLGGQIECQYNVIAYEKIIKRGDDGKVRIPESLWQQLSLENKMREEADRKEVADKIAKDKISREINSRP